MITLVVVVFCFSTELKKSIVRASRHERKTIVVSAVSVRANDVKEENNV